MLSWCFQVLLGDCQVCILSQKWFPQKIYSRISRLPFSVQWNLMVTMAVEQDFHSLLKFHVWFLHKAIVWLLNNQNKSRLDHFYNAFLTFLQLESSWSSSTFIAWKRVTLFHKGKEVKWVWNVMRVSKWGFYIIIFGWIIPLISFWKNTGANRFSLLSLMVGLSTRLDSNSDFTIKRITIDYNFYQKLYTDP